ncbi:acyltransferase [Priestia megaterium]|uniref:acyltransferase n=1 Tax=Priestia megaterium TaxID=1404 RepID=UPI001C555A3A|nr:acyltransferase [Priestia megaterium]
MNSKIHQMLLGTIGSILPTSYQPLGSLGKRFRYYCAKRIAKEIGENCIIEKGCSIGKNVSLGHYASVGIRCSVQAETRIGNHVMMGPECLIYTINHKFNKDELIFEGYTKREPVIIEDRVWIGARCIILPGVTVGKGATVGAGAVVTKNVPPYTVVAGNPAKVVKYKLGNESQNYIQEKLEI